MASYPLKHYVLIALRIAWICINHTLYFPAHLVWMLLLQPVRYFHPALYWAMESFLYRWLLALVATWGWGVGHRVMEYGDDVYRCSDSECIVIVNHQTTADVPLLFGIMQNKSNVVNRIMWVMDRIFKYTHFGFLANMHGDYFIQQGKKCRDKELQMLKDHISNVYFPLHRQWIILFPEGGFLYKRREKSQSYARRNNLPVLQNVALPRVGALQALLTIMTPGQENGTGPVSNGKAPPQNGYHARKPSISKAVKYVVDMTMGYADQDPLDFISLTMGTKGAKNVHVYYRYYPVDSIPRDTDGLTQWLYDRYVEKDHLLEVLYKTGSFPDVEAGHPTNANLHGPKQIIDNPWWFAALHLFYLTSAYFQYNVYSNLRTSL